MISNSSIYSTITTTTKIDVYVKTHGDKDTFPAASKKINPSCLETTLDNNKEPLHQSPPKCNKRTSDHRNFFNNNLPIIIHSPFTTKNGSKCAIGDGQNMNKNNEADRKELPKTISNFPL